MLKIGQIVNVNKKGCNKISDPYIIIKIDYYTDGLRLYEYNEYYLVNLVTNNKIKIKIWNNERFTDYKIHKYNHELSITLWLYSKYIFYIQQN